MHNFHKTEWGIRTGSPAALMLTLAMRSFFQKVRTFLGPVYIWVPKKNLTSLTPMLLSVGYWTGDRIPITDH